MKTLRFLAIPLALATVGLFAGHASAAPATKSVSFSASYTGTASLLISDSSLKILSVKGNGTSSLLGASAVSGSGNGATANGQCVPFSGKGSIKGAKGTISFTVSASTSQGCSSGQSGPVTVAVNGSAKVTGGSGSAAGAKGTLKFTGSLKLNDTTGSQSGTFTGALSGKLTVSK